MPGSSLTARCLLLVLPLTQVLDIAEHTNAQRTPALHRRKHAPDFQLADIGTGAVQPHRQDSSRYQGFRSNVGGFGFDREGHQNTVLSREWRIQTLPEHVIIETTFSPQKRGDYRNS